MQLQSFIKLNSRLGECWASRPSRFYSLEHKRIAYEAGCTSVPVLWHCKKKKISLFACKSNTFPFFVEPLSGPCIDWYWLHAAFSTLHKIYTQLMSTAFHLGIAPFDACFSPIWPLSPVRASSASSLKFLDHTQTQHKRQPYLSPGFEPAISASERPQTYRGRHLKCI